MPKNFRLSDAAEHARCSIYTVRRWIKTGQLPAVIVANRYLIAESDLAKFLRPKKATTPNAGA